MPCYSPLRAVLVSGPQGRRLEFSRSAVGKALSLPCGRCIGCRLERARQWAVRIVHEAQMHDESSFITLTYAPEHLPKDGSISVDECQLFLKRLRARLMPKLIRFFLCGEYGEKFGRPHYHALIFGENFISDRVPLTSPGEFALYDSPLLADIWGKGDVRIGDVSFDSAAYVANYATKKIVGSKEVVDAHYRGLTPEFLLMSRRPGIGKKWFDQFEPDVFPSDEIISRGVSVRPPRYYFEQIARRAASEFPPGQWTDLVASLKLKREEAAEELQGVVSVKGFATGVLVAESRNDRRLAVRRVVAQAKLDIKRRNMEKS